MKILFLVIFLGFFSGKSFSQNSASERFRAEEKSILESVESGKLTLTDGLRETLAASKAHFPNDTLTHAYYESALSYGIRLEKKEITHEKAQELLAIRTARYHEALRARDKENEQKKLAQEQENARLAAIAEAQRQEHARQQAIGNMLQGVGNSFRNSYGNGTNCTTSMYGNQAFTNCR